MFGTNTADQEEEICTTAASAQYPSLVVTRVLHAQPQHNAENQRHTIFQTKFVVNDRAIHVLIDDGSCNNLASEDMVQKLGLDTTTLPQPYEITWLNPGAKVQVTCMVRVPILIGSYHDHVDCDVVPMDACSLLLGRPWIYDIDALHHGRTNQYSFMFKGKKFVLEPMPPCELRKMHAQQSEQKNQQGVSASTKSDAKNMHSSYTPCSHSKLKKQVLLAAPVSLPCVANNILQDNEKESRTTPIQEGGMMRTSLLLIQL